MNKKELTERDICTKFIVPALEQAGWDIHRQVREELYFTKGRIYVRGSLSTRGRPKRADFVLSYKSNIHLAIIEAKDNKHTVGAGMQQALDYGAILDVPFIFSSNGDGFRFHDKTTGTEVDLELDQFPSPHELWERYCTFKGIQTPRQRQIVEQEYFTDGSKRTPHYYQQIAINRTLEAIAKGQNRILLVMATGTGKTYTAFQIVHRLWKSGAKKRILFLADRTALIDQTRRGDFKHFKDKMTIIKKKVLDLGNGKEELVSNQKRGIDSSDKAYEIFLGLYQGLTNNGEEEDAYKDFSPDFFDLIVIDECHRGSAADDSAWRSILDHFKNATHIGLTATPKETKEVSNIEYFGDPVYTYSLKQGIEDGFLAPYRVIRVGINVDLEGWRPDTNTLDNKGRPVKDREYNQKEYDRTLVIEERRKMVAKKITEFLQGTDPMAKTIVFCVDIEHADEMRKELVNLNAEQVKMNPKYIMKITGDDEAGKRELDIFCNPEEPYPVITTTSKLMTTGVDAKTCKLIVLDSNIESPTEFKQIIGRGTRIDEDYGKTYFTILDFRNVTKQFARPDFDGDPVKIYEPEPTEDLGGIESDEGINPEIINEIDPESGETVPVEFPHVPPFGNPEPFNTPVSTSREKVYVGGVDVSILNERQLYFDKDGKPITISLKDFTRQQILQKYRSLDAFLLTWNEAEKKDAIITELEEHGVMVADLLTAVGNECDLFDIITHVAFDMPPLTRRERAEKVRKRNYFTKYGESTRKVLEALLDKYASEGVRTIEDIKVLKINPFDTMGAPMEIINKNFHGKEQYLKAVRELETELYKDLAS